MVLLSSALEEQSVRRVLNEHVLEHVAGGGRLAHLVEEAAGDELLEIANESRLVAVGQRADHPVAEFAAEHRRQERHVLGSPEAVQARQQEILERHGNAQAYAAAGPGVALSRPR
jgi:hypothetical protein